MSRNVSADSADPPPLDSLLVKLREGDLSCAERLLREYEPYLRFILRKRFSPRLRARFDSTDVLQSVWECVVRDLRANGLVFESSSHLKAFLVKVARHRFFDQIRQNRGALDNEIHRSATGFSVPSPQPRPSEEVQAQDAWGQMLSLCPPSQQEVLRLKRNGLSLAQIAEQTGLHRDSIRRVLRNVARLYSSDNPGVGNTNPNTGPR